MSIPSEIQQAVEQALGTTILQSKRISGGDINQAIKIVTSDDQKYFVKWSPGAAEDFLTAEADGLAELARAACVRTPEVIVSGCSELEATPFLVLEWLKPGSPGAAGFATLGRQLADLHRVTRDQFGFDQDNYIGHERQRNNDQSSWGEFFFAERLMVQAQRGLEEDWLQAEELKTLEMAHPRICNILDAPEEPPALLHGDLWSGNVFWCEDGPALIDPAVYYGSREVDLAFSELFGGFELSFYQSYDESFPRATGYQKRRDILNLYYLLVHANMFAGHWIQSSRSQLKQIVS